MAASNASENLSSSYGDCDNEQTLIYGTGDDANRISPEELRKLLDTDWFKNYYEDKDGIYENDVIGKSELGDYSTMRDFYTTDCTWYRHENGLTK